VYSCAVLLSIGGGCVFDLCVCLCICVLSLVLLCVLFCVLCFVFLLLVVAP